MFSVSPFPYQDYLSRGSCFPTVVFADRFSSDISCSDNSGPQCINVWLKAAHARYHLEIHVWGNVSIKPTLQLALSLSAIVCNYFIKLWQVFHGQVPGIDSVHRDRVLWIELYQSWMCTTLPQIKGLFKVSNKPHFDQLEYCSTGCREFDFQWMLPSAFEVHTLNDYINRAGLARPPVRFRN